MREKLTTVYRTNDYDSFKYLNGNRDVDEKRVNNVIESINTVGYVLSPIVVNEKMEIIDGQARVQALKRLSLPVDYVVCPGAGINECIYLNVKTMAWKLNDYIAAYAKLGNVSYQYLQCLFTQFEKQLKPDAIINAVHPVGYAGDHGHSRPIITSGRFTCTTEQYEHAIEILSYEAELVGCIKSEVSGSARPFLFAIRFLYDAGLVDRGILKKKVLKNSNLLTSAATTEEALKVLEAIYNRQSRNKVYGFEAAFRKVRTDRVKKNGKQRKAS